MLKINVSKLIAERDAAISRAERAEALLDKLAIRVRDHNADTDYVMTGVDWPKLLEALDSAELIVKLRERIGELEALNQTSVDDAGSEDT